MTGMDQNTVDGFFTLVAVILTGITFFGTIIRLAKMAGSITKKIIIGLAFFGTWAAAQMGAFLLVFKLTYCENCSGRPITSHDLLMYLILIAPSCLAFLLFLISFFVKYEEAS
ncbi:MAG: hypothetical protein ABI728_08770 [Betaproteobacteria bacterium]